MDLTFKTSKDMDLSIEIQSIETIESVVCDEINDESNILNDINEFLNEKSVSTGNKSPNVSDNSGYTVITHINRNNVINTTDNRCTNDTSKNDVYDDDMSEISDGEIDKCNQVDMERDDSDLENYYCDIEIYFKDSGEKGNISLKEVDDNLSDISSLVCLNNNSNIGDDQQDGDHDDNMNLENYGGDIEPDNGDMEQDNGEKMNKDKGGLGFRKYCMPLESERNIYITGATILAMKGIITYEEYSTNTFKKKFPQEFLDKKFYLGEVLGALRGMTRLKLAHCKDRSPSITMFNRMKEEEEELLANGCEFVTDSDGHTDEESRYLSSLLKTKSVKSNKNVGESSNSNKPNRLFHLAEKSLQRSIRKSKLKIKKNYDKNKEIKKTAHEKEKELPDELLHCGDCGISISGLLHLHIHLERCRGSKRKQNNGSNNEKSKTFNSDNPSEESTSDN